MAMILVGTDEGFRVLGGWGPEGPSGPTVDAIARGGDAWWAIRDGSAVWHHSDDGSRAIVALLEEDRANCLLPTQAGLLVGASRARLYHLHDDTLEPVEGFDEAPGRDAWHTPWGGPPDVRSMAEDRNGSIYLNVHVGGILRSSDRGDTWEPTMDIGTDVHEVYAHPMTSGLVLAAAAVGLGISTDGAERWTFHTDGLHGTYCRAVAVTSDMVLVSASLGSRGEQAAVYRRPLDGEGPFRKCSSGLPEWFSDNVDTFCLAGVGETAVIGDRAGTVYLSEDQGERWEVVADKLPGVRCIAIA